VSHMRNEAEVTCLPKDLPEFIEVDISGLSLNESIHLSQLKVPEGVTLVELAKEDSAVVAIHSPRAEEPEPTAAAAAGAPADGAAGAPAAAAGGDAAKAAAPAKKEDAKKEPAKKDAKK
jgi:large subunit ribosomal protein L25